MRKFFTTCALGLALAASSALAGQLTGTITCGKCKNTSPDNADCAKTCIKSGEPAIFVSEDKKVYKIANPAKIGDHINVKVNVEGDVKGDTLTLASVNPA